MAFQHHGGGMSDKIRKLFEDEQKNRERFSEQVAGRAKRSWSDGRIGAEDDGDLAFAVGPHPDRELVVIDFGHDVQFIAMPPQQAIELAQTLIKHARAISSEPLTIRLH